MDEVAEIIANITEKRQLVTCPSSPSLSEAFDLQDQVLTGIAALRGGFGGYKIAWNLPALMEKFAMPHPGMGRVFADDLRSDGVTLQLSDFANLMMEPEIIARLAADIAPGDDLRPEALAEKVAGFTAGFEILDRLGASPEEKAPTIIAYNVFNSGAVFGENWVDAASLDTALMETVVTCDDKVIAQGVGIAPQPPLEALSFLAGHFTGRGQTMKAGQIVLCGSHMPLYPIVAPCRVSVSMSAIGEAGFSVV